MGIEQLIASQSQRTAGLSPMEMLSGMQSLEGQKLGNESRQLLNSANAEKIDANKRQRGLEFAANVGQQIKALQDPQKKAETYATALQFAKMNGHDVTPFPKEYNDQAQGMLDAAYYQVYAPAEMEARLKGRGISMGQAEFNDHVNSLAGAVGPDGVLDPSKLTLAQRASAIKLRLIPGAQGSAAITAATQGLTDLVANSQEKIKTMERYGSDSGKNAAKYDDLAGAWDVNREFLVESIPELRSAFSDAPGSSVSRGVQSVLSKAIGNTKGADAQAMLEQYGSIFLQGMPFPPGAQSDKEMQARAQTLSDQLVNPNVSADTKIKLIGTFVEWQDKTAKNYKAKSGQIIGRESSPSVQQPQLPAKKQGETTAGAQQKAFDLEYDPAAGTFK